MKLRILILFLLPLTFALSACRSSDTGSDPFFQPTEADKLTAEETESIIWHAKHFIASNKNLRLGTMLFESFVISSDVVSEAWDFIILFHHLNNAFLHKELHIIIIHLLHGIAVYPPLFTVYLHFVSHSFRHIIISF